MTDIVVRNPVGRWMFPLLVGVGQFVLCSGLGALAIAGCAQPGTCTGGDIKTVLVIGGPILVIFLLFAWVSFRTTVTLCEEGIVVRRLFVANAYPWSDIALVRKVRAGNDKAPELKVELVFTDGSAQELPAPRAYGAFGARGYVPRADTIWREWWRRDQASKIQADPTPEAAHADRPPSAGAG